MTHARGVALMIACGTMWSISGVVSRQLEQADGFEVAFWRSLFTVLALVPLLAWLRGGLAPLARDLRAGGRALWASAMCWGLMFTAFMLALTLTTVANVLVTLALTPLLTALVARYAIGHRLARRTQVAIVLASVGIAWMYGTELDGASARQLLGIAIALSVPLAAAVNWTVLQYAARSSERAGDMLPAVLLGAALGTVATLPLAVPFAATTADIAWLALLGVVQLAIPCVLAVFVTRVLSAPEMSLFGQLEVVLGVTWVWLAGGETPSAAVLGGGGLVLLALILNEALGLVTARRLVR